MTAILGFMKSFETHCVCLKQLFDNIALSVIEVAVEISLSEGGEITYPTDERLHVSDAVFLSEII